MNCPRCQTANPAEARFCHNCGAALPLRCSNCQAELLPAARFCMYCGQPIRVQTSADDARLGRLTAAAPSPLVEKVRAAAHPSGERRYVTVLFVDVVGSTALAEQLGTEAWSVLLNGFFDQIAPLIYRYEGTLARMLGDALVAFFGMPVAHEDDPLRAVMAAFEILATTQQYARQLRQQFGVEFSVRACLNRGLMALGAVGEDLRYEYAADGGVVNLAARLKFAAQPMSILITEEVHRFVAHAIDCEDIGYLEVKGRGKPVRAYRVLGHKAAPGSLRGLVGLSSPMVGRDREVQQLMHLCEAVRAGLGRVVLIIGEPGIGKSRLIAEWQALVGQRYQASSVQWAEAHSHSYAQSAAYHLAGHLATSLLGIPETAGEAEVRVALRALVADLLGDPESNPAIELYASLAHLLSLNVEPTVLQALQAVEPEALQARYLASLRRLIEGLAARRPIVLVMDDLHWADPSSLELLARLLPLVYTTPVLFCLAIRPDREVQGWKLITAARELLGSSLTEIHLEPLTDQDSRLLVANLLAIESLPEEIRALILRKAEGNPYFVEEIIRMLIEGGAIVPSEHGWAAGADLGNTIIPDNLQGLLMARIDRLPEQDRRVLRVASVVGRQFPVKVLEQVMQDSPHQQSGALGVLGSLENAGLVSLARLEPELEYHFRHTLVQEAAYASLLLGDRRQLHLMVGQAVEKLYPDHLEENAAMLAWHFYEADQAEQALHYYLLAGQAALKRYANQEAEQHYSQAMLLAPTDRQRAELIAGLGLAISRQGRMQEAIQIWMEGVKLYQSLGDSNGAARLYARAARAAWHGGDTPRGLQICLEGLAANEGSPLSAEYARLVHETARAYYFNGDAAQAARMCRQALELAEQLDAVEVQADALATLGLLPDLPTDEAIDALQQAVALSEARQLLRVAHRAHINLATMLRSLKGDTLGSYKHYQRALEISRLRGVPQEIMLSLAAVLQTSLMLGEFDAVERGITELEAILEDLSDPAAVQDEIDSLRAALLGARGDWLAALEIARKIQSKARRRGDLQMLYNASAFLAWELLELDYFLAPQDLSEAERAIQDAMTIGMQGIGDRVEPQCRLSIVRARQGNLTQAEQLLMQARQDTRQRRSIWEEMFFYQAEAELARARARWEDVIAASEALVDIHSRTNQRWEWARALLFLAQAHVSRGEAEDLSRAQAFFNLALDLFKKMNATGYVRFIETRLLDLQFETETRVLAARQASQEMLRAGRIQSSFLPERVPELEGWELAVALEPASQTSGDFYDFIPLPGNRLGLVVADVTDKGAGAALFMASCRTLIRTYAERYPSRPEQVLTAVNRRLLLDTRAGLYITVFYGVLDPSDGQLVYCNAGHNPPFLFRTLQGQVVEPFSASGMAVGIMSEARWSQQRVQLEPLDVLFLYTDGVTEAQDERQALYGEVRMLNAARQALSVESGGLSTAQEALDALLSDIHDFVGGAPHSDDLTLMVLRRAK